MSYSSIKVAILPINIQQANPQSNINAVKQLVASPTVIDTDVFVLPELFSTGFIADPELILKYSETKDGPTLTALREISKEKNAAFAGSILFNEDNRFFNRAFFISPDGKEVFYDKRHLFSISPESRVLSGGKTTCPIIKFRGWTFSMVICYDIRFPVWCRNVEQAAQIMLVPANWPIARKYAWEHLLIARAIENQCYVIGANRSGDDEYGNYDNMSFIFDPWGKPTYNIDTETGIITALFERDFINEVRRRLPVENDADSFKILDL